MERQFTGTVIRTTGSWYDVRTNAGETVKCRIRGRLRLKGVRSTNPVVVGDRVVCERDEEDAGVICEVVPRRNYIIRRASNLSKESHIIAANLDRAPLVVTLFSPVTAPGVHRPLPGNLRGLPRTRHDSAGQSRPGGTGSRSRSRIQSHL